MKNPFRKNMTENLEKTIAAFAKRGLQLDAQRRSAQEALEKATAARQAALLGSEEIDDQKLAKLQRVVGGAASLLAGIEEAIGILWAEKAQAEGRLAEEKDKIKRAEAADKFGAQVAAIEAGVEPWLAQSRTWANALGELAYAHFGCDEMHNFLQSCMAQLEVAANFQLTELRGMPQAIRDGSMPIPKKPEAAPIVAAEPVAETRRLFTMRVVKFKDHTGAQRFCQQFEDVDLPIAAASRGLRCGALIGLDDPRRKELRGARGGVPIAKNVALDLDDEIACRPSHIEPIMRSDPIANANFTVTEGPAIMGTISVARG